MRLATFEHAGTERWGLVLRHPVDTIDWIFDPAAVLDAARRLPALKGGGYTWWRPDFAPPGETWPSSLTGILALGSPAVEAVLRMHDFLLRYLEQGDPLMLAGAGWPVTGIRLRAPFPQPRLLLGVVGNNAGFLRMDPARARNLHQPSCHQRTQTSIVGPGEAIVLPPGGEAYAGTTELGVVIGRGGRDIPREHAREHIAGYTVVNDGLGSLYARRWAGLDRTAGADGPHFHAANTASWLDKKSDGMLALGPWIVTPDEIGDPYDLLCWYRENGVVRNRAHSGALVCSIEETIHWLSRFLTLEPGMVIHFGAMGQDGLTAAPVEARNENHHVECEIERVGILRNPLRVASASPTVQGTRTGGTPAPPSEPWTSPTARHFWTLLANTRAAATRTHIAPRSYPLAYNSPPTALAASGGHVRLPAGAGTLTATCELGVVIGRPARSIRREDVAAHLLGSVTILALRDSSFADCLVLPHVLPANMPEIYARWPDGFNVISAVAACPDASGEFAACALQIQLGAEHASATSADYLLSAADVVAELSRGITLQPGDVVSLGETGATLTVPRIGGVLRAQIDGIGEVSATIPAR